NSVVATALRAVSLGATLEYAPQARGYDIIRHTGCAAMCRRGDRSAPSLQRFNAATCTSNQFAWRVPINPIQVTDYGLRRSLNYLDYSCWSCHWRDRKAADARERSRWLHRHDSARHRGRTCRHLDRSPFYGREL